MSDSDDVKVVVVQNEKHASLRMLEQACREARAQGATDDDRVLFGQINLDKSFSPIGPALAFGWAPGCILIVVQDCDVPILEELGRR